VCHCSRKSRVFRAFSRALLAGHGLRKTWSRAVLSVLEMNVLSRQAVAHLLVIYRLSHCFRGPYLEGHSSTSDLHMQAARRKRTKQTRRKPLPVRPTAVDQEET
jgi:hypothetical protein